MNKERFFLTSANLNFYPHSLVRQGGLEYGLAQTADGPRLAVLGTPGARVLTDFEGERSELRERTLLLGAPSPHNAAALRNSLAWLQPGLLGLRTSAGMGDRIGLATPGHVCATRATGGHIAPIFAQQSIREMTRTGRSSQQVMDDATWGIFQEGWKDGVGADADHLKTAAEIDACLTAGFTFFTIDPGALVENHAGTASLNELRELSAVLPGDLQPHVSGLLNRTFAIEDFSLHFDEATLLKANVKYGRAIWHVATMYHHLARVAGSRPFELEVSVDETEQPTSNAEHL
jgi:hypothetical protein